MHWLGSCIDILQVGAVHLLLFTGQEFSFALAVGFVLLPGLGGWISAFLNERVGNGSILSKGTITDHRNGVATDYGPGVGWPEDRNTTHWLENRGTISTVEISVDIVRQA